MDQTAALSLVAMVATAVVGPAIAPTSTVPAAAPAGATTSAPSPAAPKPAAAPLPAYIVVEGAHTEDATPFQSLTVLCPPGRRAFGAGFSAIVRAAPTPAAPAKPGAATPPAPAYRDSGLNDVRSFPDANGSGWRVEGVSPVALNAKTPWRLAVRVVCAQVPS